MTGIDEDLLMSGKGLETSIRELKTFIRGTVLVGYNISFDIKFLNKALGKFSLEPIHNKTVELMSVAKRKNSFQANYKFETTLKEYGINKSVRHRALEDAKLMYQLYKQMGL